MFNLADNDCGKGNDFMPYLLLTLISRLCLRSLEAISFHQAFNRPKMKGLSLVLALLPVLASAYVDHSRSSSLYIHSNDTLEARKFMKSLLNILTPKQKSLNILIPKSFNKDDLHPCFRCSLCLRAMISSRAQPGPPTPSSLRLSTGEKLESSNSRKTEFRDH